MRALVTALAILSLAASARADDWNNLPGASFDQAKATPWLAQPSRPGLVLSLELAYQIVSAADVATTIRSGRCPGVSEAGALGLFGPHPTARQDVAFGLGRGALHAIGAAILARRHVANEWVLMYEGGTFGAEAFAVSGNAKLGSC